MSTKYDLVLLVAEGLTTLDAIEDPLRRIQALSQIDDGSTSLHRAWKEIEDVCSSHFDRETRLLVPALAKTGSQEIFAVMREVRYFQIRTSEIGRLLTEGAPLGSEVADYAAELRSHLKRVADICRELARDD